jgi:hypothetical protein
MNKFLALFSLLFIVGCSDARVEQLRPNISRDGIYEVEVTLKEGTIIYFNVTERSGGMAKSIQSGASDVMKWAAGWFASEAILVMYSSDIGTKAWSARSNWKEIKVTPELRDYAKKLYSIKYGKP